MKRPDEIKKGMECAVDKKCIGKECPYFNEEYSCISTAQVDALALIRQLEAENAELLEKVKQLERERDAAVNDLSAGYRCGSCKRYFGNGDECPGGRFCILGGFEWRGPCKENGGSDE